MTENIHNLRNYEKNIINNVEITYRNMYENQNRKYVEQQLKINLFPLWEKPFTIKNTLDYLDTFIDESDPDTNKNQSIHSFQTALSMEKLYQNNFLIKNLFSINEYNALPDFVKSMYESHQTLFNLIPILQHQSNFLITTALVHDFGKILYLKSYPQWSVVGDTFAIGLTLSDDSPFSDKKYHIKNKDIYECDSKTYKEGCGFENMFFSFGHDEYMAKVLERSNTNLPKEAIYIIRYHSLYCWHSPKKENRSYELYANNEDWRLLPLLKLFRICDLYSKSESNEILKEKIDRILKISQNDISNLLL